jgi:hypothetical protein
VHRRGQPRAFAFVIRPRGVVVARDLHSPACTPPDAARDDARHVLVDRRGDDDRFSPRHRRASHPARLAGAARAR